MSHGSFWENVLPAFAWTKGRKTFKKKSKTKHINLMTDILASYHAQSDAFIRDFNLLLPYDELDKKPRNINVG